MNRSLMVCSFFCLVSLAFEVQSAEYICYVGGEFDSSGNPVRHPALVVEGRSALEAMAQCQATIKERTGLLVTPALEVVKKQS